MFERRLRGAVGVRAFCCGVVIVMAQTLVAEGQARGGSGPAHASGRKGALAPVTFTYTGGEQTYTVPAGVSALEVQAVGADGGPQEPYEVSGGTGGMVIGELAVGSGTAVTPGKTLYVGVGGTSDDGQGGFNGGGSGGSEAGGGGGATDVRTCSPTSASCANGVSSLLTRLIIAAGGGGAGDFEAGGAGGSAGQPGSDSPLAPGSGLGGGAGTLLAPGAPGGGGATPGGLGTGGRGGSEEIGGSAGGGGGGAGYFGGGGGGVGRAVFNGRNVAVSSGGGGGASFASPFVVSGVSFGLGDGTPRLLITPRPASAVRVSRIYYNSPGPDTGSNKSLNAEFVRLTNTSGTVQQLRGWTISDSEGHVYRFGPLGLQPGQSVTVHTGHGRDTPKDRYWNRRGYAWDNTRDLVRVHTADGTLADQCRYDDSRASQLRC
jgi:Lamin Tail Domain/Glycine rich protein